MEKVKFESSTKNISVPNKENYRRRLIEMTEKFTRRMRWRAFFFLNPNAKEEIKENFGFNSRRSPPVIEEMREFEDKLKNLITNIEFKYSSNSFQRKINKDVNNIRKEDKVLVKADKTRNYYKLKSEQYKSLLQKNIEKNYRKVNNSEIDVIAKQEKKLAQSIELEDRIEKTAIKEAFITLKDHKDNFENNPTCRLINPSKSEMGKVSKRILEKVVNEIKSVEQLNLWRNTEEVIDWFKDIKKTKSSTFINFDIVDFYPSINEKLLNDALDFANKLYPIAKNERDTIIKCKNNLLHGKNDVWAKNTKSKTHFDVTMGSFDGAETCELVGLFLLSSIKKTYGNNIGLYRDDGLGILNQTPKQAEKTKQQIAAIFKKYDLKITIDVNKKIINFLDVSFDLEKEEYKPYKKPDDVPIYVNIHSNHPPSVLKAIPKGINKRLSTLSSNEKIFRESTAEYQEALRKSGYNYRLEFQQAVPKEKKQKKRNRNITWFNPPYSNNVKTNVGAQFFHILQECFPASHILNKIFNRNTVKLSYSCMPNIKKKHH